MTSENGFKPLFVGFPVSLPGWSDWAILALLTTPCHLRHYSAKQFESGCIWTNFCQLTRCIYSTGALQHRF